MDSLKNMPRRLSLATAGIGILCALYLLLTVGAYVFVHHIRGITEVRYLDMALPARWPRYQTELGEHQVKVAVSLMQQGDYPEAFFQVRAGLARAPASLSGRQLLAEFYAASQRPDLAEKTLLAGLHYHAGKPAYVALTIQFLLDRQEDRRAIQLCDELLQTPSTPAAVADQAAYGAASACYFRGDYDGAEAYLAKRHLIHTREGRLLRARIAEERGYHDLALFQVRDLARDFPQDEEIRAQMGGWLRQAGRLEEARRLALLHQFAHPDRPRAYLDQLEILATAGDQAAIDRTAAQMLETFADNPNALLALGDFAANTGQVAWARRVQEHFHHRQFAHETAVQLLTVEAGLMAKRYGDALREVRAVANAAGLEPTSRNVCLGLEAIAHYGLGDRVAGLARLTAMLVQPDLRAESLLGVADRLIAMGERNAAREVLARTIKADPKSQRALTHLVALDLDDQNMVGLSVHLRPLLTMRKPAPDLLRRAQTLLQSNAALSLPDREPLLEAVTRALPARREVAAD